jgi:hypothetical protein
MTSDPHHLDGNAVGGLLGEVFTADLTTAAATCAGCGNVAPVAVMHVYLDAPGVVGRCATCGIVHVRVVQSADRTWLDLRGIRALEIRRVPPVGSPPHP